MKTSDDRPDLVLRLAAKMSEAWRKYLWLFGDVPPHGTKPQMAALLELGVREWLHERDKRLADFAVCNENKRLDGKAFHYTTDNLLGAFEKAEQEISAKSPEESNDSPAVRV